MSNFVLTPENYYTPEADWHYLSCSQYDLFEECEAKAMAKLQGRFVGEESDALFQGRYFHSYFEGSEAFEEFCQANFDAIFKSKTDKKTGEVIVTGKYAPFVKLDEMIAAAENDPVIKKYIDMPGENEVVMTGRLFDKYPWRIRLDKYIPQMQLILDWKTAANLWEMKYSPAYKTSVTFIHSYNYLRRAAIYTEIEKQFSGRGSDAAFILVCLTKQDPPDKEIIMLNHRQEYDRQLEMVLEKLSRIDDLKHGRAAPTRCRYCDYCRSTKVLDPVMISYWELEPANRPPRQEDYAYDHDFENPLVQQDQGT